MAAQQKTQIVTRGLIFYREHLLVVRWREPVMPPVESFPVGGRVEFGETVVEALHREVQEELGCSVVAHRLLYTHENFFHLGGIDFREYGWYFLVELDRPALEIGAVRPQPDHPALELVYLPVRALGEQQGFYPAALRRMVPEDWQTGFAGPPRHLVSRPVGGHGQQHELYRMAGDGSPPLRRWQTG